ncbi:endolytic transglycosylase MltG [candidate division KSB1 bacterium]|nr:endolytic transglycosylase MltG [candidate division KSB1 bacterium]
MKKKLIIFFSLFLFILLLFSIWVYYILFDSHKSLHNDQNITVIVKSGMSVGQIANLLYDKNLIYKTKDFIWGAKLMGTANKLKAGRYEIPKGKNNYHIIKLLDLGKISSIRVVIPEGIDSRKISSLLAHNLGIDSLKLISYVDDSVFIHSMNIPGISLEGYLFPETYDFYWGQDEESVIKRMVNQFIEVVPDSILRISKINPKQFNEIITLASIIQGEAIVAEEMPIISGVYTNRLKRRMLLQADPTLQYIIEDGPRRLTNKDKKIQSPYNTYLYLGLPPGPINNPGLNAILSAANPEKVPYLYFVANGDGTHTFSRTLNEHLNAKRKFDKIRREVYRKQRLEKTN